MNMNYFPTVPTVQNVPTQQVMNSQGWAAPPVPQFQQRQGPQIFSRMVNSVEEAKAAGIDAFNLFIFPHFAEGKIYVRYIPTDGNGRSVFQTFNMEIEAEPQVQQEVAPPQNMVTMEQFGTLVEELRNLKGAIDDVQQLQLQSAGAAEPSTNEPVKSAKSGSKS